MTYNNKPDATKPKRRSILGTMFNPDIGNSIRPIGESLNGFINILAIIFAMNGLFPKNHPALKGDGSVRLNLSDVIGTAWESLQFTKTGMPRVIVFFAVVGGLLCATFSLITIIIVSFMGHAHAQTFTPTDTTHDLGWNIIDYLFSPSNTAGAYGRLNTDYGSLAGGVMPNANLQVALWSALGFFSNAMLVCAGLLLAYHLISMVMNTAHSGVVMGKNANQVWAPLRLAAAVMLLVPVSANLNAGQMLVMQVAQWGSGLATNIWLGFEAALTSGANAVSIPTTPNNTAIADIVIKSAQILACEYYYNAKVANAATAIPGTPAFADPNLLVSGWTWSYLGTPTLPPPEILPDGTAVYHFEPAKKQMGQDDLCGKITIPPMGRFIGTGDVTTDLIGGNMYMAVYQAFFNAMDTNSPSIRDMAKGVQIFFTDNNIAADSGDIDSTALVGNIALAVNSFQNDLNSKVVTAASITITPTNKYAKMGWLGAAPYWNQVAAQQSVVQSAAMDAMPQIQLPKVNMGAFTKVLNKSFGSTANNAALAPVVRTGGGGCTSVAASADSGQLTALVAQMDLANLVKDLFIIADHFAAEAGVWCEGDGLLGVRFTGSDPLHQMAGWGHANIEASVGIFNFSLWLIISGSIASEGILGRVATGIGALLMHEKGVICDPSADSAPEEESVNPAGDGIGVPTAPAPGNCHTNPKNQLSAGALAIATAVPGAASVLGEALLPLGAIFFTLGTLFGYILPLVPFMHFFFGIITWIAILFEAVIAMPLVALAHITPEGEGLPGPHARNAYQMAFGLLLRPTLMIFGLVAGYLCLILAASLLNMFFSGALHVTAGSGSVVKIAKLIYSVIYCMVLVTVANHAFKLIDHFPRAVLGWIGFQTASGTQMGDPNHIEKLTVAAAGFASSQISSSAAKGAGSLGRGAGGALQGAGSFAMNTKALGDANAAAIDPQTGEASGNRGSILGNMGAISGRAVSDKFSAQQGSATAKGPANFGTLAAEQTATNDASKAAFNQKSQHKDIMGGLGAIATGLGNLGGGSGGGSSGGGFSGGGGQPSSPGGNAFASMGESLSSGGGPSSAETVTQSNLRAEAQADVSTPPANAGANAFSKMFNPLDEYGEKGLADSINPNAPIPGKK